MLAPNVDNTIARFLAWPHPALSRTGFIAESDDESVVAAALERLDTFGYVNVVENARFQAPQTNLEITGTVALNEQSPLNLRVQGNMNLALAAIVYGAGRIARERGGGSLQER